jgi:hypothetical protein
VKPKQKTHPIPTLGRPARRAVLVVHVTASASWLEAADT